MNTKRLVHCKHKFCLYNRFQPHFSLRIIHIFRKRNVNTGRITIHSGNRNIIRNITYNDSRRTKIRQNARKTKCDGTRTTVESLLTIINNMFLRYVLILLPYCSLCVLYLYQYLSGRVIEVTN